MHPYISHVPVHVFLSLYDIKAKKKLSEDLCIAWNANLVPPSPSPETAAQRGLFELLNVESEDIFLCARLYSLGEDASKEKESKKDKEKEKDKDKKKSSGSSSASEISTGAFSD